MYYDNRLPRGTVTFIPAVRGGLGFTTTDQTAGVTTTAGNIAGAFLGIPGFGTILNSISNALGIGTGRKEADRIVPTQNQLGDFLAKVSAYIPTATSAANLQVVANQLSQAWTAFQSFIFNRTQFPDGRASQQAHDTIAPIVNGLQSAIADKMRQLGGGRGALQIIQDAGTYGLYPTVYGEPMIPQAGTLNPYEPVPGYQSASLLSGPLMPFLLAGGVGLFLFRKKV